MWVLKRFEIDLQDQHVETVNLHDSHDLVVIQVYITNAYRAYAFADHYRKQGAYVILGGLHVTSLPEEAALHGDSIFIGPGEETFPQFIKDFKAGTPKKKYSNAAMIRTCRRPAPRVRSRTLSWMRWYLLISTEAISTISPVIILNAAIKRITNPIFVKTSSSTLKIRFKSMIETLGKRCTTSC